MYYEELVNGSWERLEIQGEMLVGVAHHVIYFDPPSRWLQHPEWARHRRDEIIARIKSEFREPDYEYDDNVSAAPLPAQTAPPPAAAATSRPAAAQTLSATSPREMRTLGVAIALMFLLAAGMGLLVVRGLTRGDTFSPTKRATLRRAVSRAEEPVMFWVSIGLYATIGIGALGLGAWGVREGRRLSSTREV